MHEKERPAAIWLAGVKLSDTTDILAQRFGLGQALGGVILLRDHARASAGERDRIDMEERP